MRKDLLFSLIVFVVLGMSSIASAQTIDLHSYTPKNSGSPALKQVIASERTARLAADEFLPDPDASLNELNSYIEDARAGRCSRLLQGANPHILSAGYCYAAKFFLYLVTAAGIIAVVMVVWGGLRYITSGGDPKGTEEARKIIWGGILGGIITTLSFAIAAYTANLAEQVITPPPAQTQNN